jgi:hypothetical protein
MKRILRVVRLRLRRRSGVHHEFLLTAIAQNLRRLAVTFQSRRAEVLRRLFFSVRYLDDPGRGEKRKAYE